MTPENNAEVDGWRLSHSYAALDARLFTAATPTVFPKPRLVLWNQLLADALGLALSEKDSKKIEQYFAGGVMPPGAMPIAMAYAGYQFGHFTHLGDGRAILLGEQMGVYDIHIKGAGQTVYSRRGDGRAALGPMLREYIISEAMHALGVPTTRSLAVIATGETVHRERALEGAMLVRVAGSHLRVGTAEFVATQRDIGLMRRFMDYVIARHYPEIGGGDERYVSLYRAIMQRQAELVAQWMRVGFVHGVMNTDNMALSGETIDYGPCAFIDRADMNAVFSSIDHQGRYAFGRQPMIAQWNLARLAEAMLPLFAAEEDEALEVAEELVGEYSEVFAASWLAMMRRKLGLMDAQEGDFALAQDALRWMHEAGVDYTRTFRGLAGSVMTGAAGDAEAAWHARWLARVRGQEAQAGRIVDEMNEANPAVIPRNHKVEEALAAAVAGDMGPVHALLEVLMAPYREPEDESFMMSPSGDDAYVTFCGT